MSLEAPGRRRPTCELQPQVFLHEHHQRLKLSNVKGGLIRPWEMFDSTPLGVGSRDLRVDSQSSSGFRGRPWNRNVGRLATVLLMNWKGRDVDLLPSSWKRTCWLLIIARQGTALGEGSNKSSPISFNEKLFLGEFLEAGRLCVRNVHTRHVRQHLRVFS